MTDDDIVTVIQANKFSSDPLAIYRAVIAARDEELRKQEPVAWMIECSNAFVGWWNDTTKLDCRYFDADPNKGRRFNTKEEAEELIQSKGNSCMKATGHLWVNEGTLKDGMKLSAAPIPPEQTGDALVEGMYQKMWKDFVSLQRGDAKQICVEAELYRKSLTAPIPPTPSQQEALDHLSNLLKYDSSESWVAVKAFILARPDAPIPPDNHDWKAEYLRQVDLHNQTLDELREAEMQLRNPAPTPPTPSQQEALNDLRELDTNFEFEGRMAVLRFKRE